MLSSIKKAILRNKKIYTTFKNIAHINNWNLVDSSAHHIIGHYLFDKDIEKLYQLATSTNMWHRRIAIVATWYFIRQSKLDTTFAIAKLLLKDPHDLIHKSVGWMLREAGKKTNHCNCNFLINTLIKCQKQCCIMLLKGYQRRLNTKIMDGTCDIV